MAATSTDTIHAVADPTTSYTFSNARVCDDHNQAALFFTTAGTAPTSWEWKVQFSNDGGSTWFDELTEEVSAGTVVQRVAVRSIQDAAGNPANGTYMAHIALGGAERFRLAIKRTGGDATSTIAVGMQKRTV